MILIILSLATSKSLSHRKLFIFADVNYANGTYYTITYISRQTNPYTFSNCLFHEIYSTSNLNGGAVSLNVTSAFFVTRCLFVFCGVPLGSGGAIWASGRTPTVNYTCAYRCEARGSNEQETFGQFCCIFSRNLQDNIAIRFCIVHCCPKEESLHYKVQPDYYRAPIWADIRQDANNLVGTFEVGYTNTSSCYSTHNTGCIVSEYSDTAQYRYNYYVENHMIPGGDSIGDYAFLDYYTITKCYCEQNNFIKNVGGASMIVIHGDSRATGGYGFFNFASASVSGCFFENNVYNFCFILRKVGHSQLLHATVGKTKETGTLPYLHPVQVVIVVLEDLSLPFTFHLFKWTVNLFTVCSSGCLQHFLSQNRANFHLRCHVLILVQPDSQCPPRFHYQPDFLFPSWILLIT